MQEPMRALCLVLLIAGCSGDTDPFPNGQATQTPAPATTSTPTAVAGTATPAGGTATPAGSTPTQAATQTPRLDGAPTPAPGTTPAASLSLTACTVEANQLSPANQVTLSQDGTYRYIVGNGMPDHSVGAFPNPGNPNTITSQDVDYRMPLTPAGAGKDYELGEVGVGINGVKFDPGAAEFWQDDRQSGWQYEPHAGGIDLGLDCNYAHVQPGGSYHYHGMPTGLMDNQGEGPQIYLVGYMADGYPLFAKYGYSDAQDSSSPVRALISSYRIKDGTRPDGPGGQYDGTFTQDYEYVEGLGDLDACNGRTGATPNHGTTYYYVLTGNYPYLPRCTIHAADASFAQQGPPPGGPPGGP